MSEQTYLVSDAEVQAAKDMLDHMSDLAGREQPVPSTLIRVMLEEAAKIRAGMKPASQGARGIGL